MRVRTCFGFALGLVCLTGAFMFTCYRRSVYAQPQFSPNQELPLPLTAGQLPVQFIVRGLEPSNRTDSQGTIYVTSIRGVPGGVDLHRWSPLVDPAPNSDGTLPFVYLGQPDGCGIFASGCDLVGVAEGGGDVDIAVNVPGLASSVPNLALVSLTLAPGVTSTHSSDRGQSFSQPNPVAALIPGDDRQWIDGIDSQTVYLSYHDAATFNIEVQRSNDGGNTYVDGFGEAIDAHTFPAVGGVPATNTANVAGPIRVDRTNCPSRNNLYQVFVGPDNAQENLTGQTFRSVYVGSSTDVNLGLPVFTFTDHKIFTGPMGSSGENLFPALDVDGFGNVYAVWSDNSTIYFSSSTDQGSTWSTAVPVNQGATVGKANVFPWIAADANGHAVVVWFGADRAGNSNNTSVMEPCAAGSTTCMTDWANWNVYLAETTNGHDAAPVFVQSVASDHVVHRGTISTGGLGGGANRNLGDYFQVSLDPQHRANIAFSDDHKLSPLTVSGHTGIDDPQARRLIRANFTRQLQAIPGIVTTGVCAATTVAPGSKITGKGMLPGAATFGFIAKSTPLNGALQYQDGGASLKARSSNGIDSLTFSGRCGTFTGNAKINDQPGYRFRIQACDNTDSGTGQDTFSIDFAGPNGFAYHRDGTITDGNIKLQSQ